MLNEYTHLFASKTDNLIMDVLLAIQVSYLSTCKMHCNDDTTLYKILQVLWFLLENKPTFKVG